MPVSSTHTSYLKALKKWDLVRSINDSEALELLPIVDPNDMERSQAYKKFAILTNYTYLTKEGLKGLVFRKPAVTELPEELYYILDDATGTNLELEQLAQFCVDEVLINGRCGLLTDYPKFTDATSLVDSEDDNLPLCRIKPYTAKSIINWATQVSGSRTQLSLVVLKEEVDQLMPDGFQWNTVHQHRVLQIVGGIYKQTVYNDRDQIVEEIYPTDFEGKNLREIPFTFIGAQNNDERIDKAPLYDIAVVNLGHYRNSADLEESVFLCGQIMLWLAYDSSKEEFEAANPQGVRFGSRGAFNLGPNGKAGLLQGSPNQLVDSVMIRKEAQIAAIGARLIAPAGGRETAEAARMRYGSQNSALYILTHNISAAIQKQLKIAALFQIPESRRALNEIKYELNSEFYDETTDPNLLSAAWIGVDKQVIRAEEIREYLRRTGFLDQFSKEIQVEEFGKPKEELVQMTDQRPDAEFGEEDEDPTDS